MNKQQCWFCCEKKSQHIIVLSYLGSQTYAGLLKVCSNCGNIKGTKSLLVNPDEEYDFVEDLIMYGNPVEYPCPGYEIEYDNLKDIDPSIQEFFDEMDLEEQ